MAKKKKMTASQAASARWKDNPDYQEEDFEMESEAAFWWRKMGRRGQIRLILVILILLFGFWFILGMPGVVTHPFGLGA